MESVSERHHSSTLQLYMKSDIVQVRSKSGATDYRTRMRTKLWTQCGQLPCCWGSICARRWGRDIRRLCTYGTNRKFTEWVEGSGSWGPSLGLAFYYTNLSFNCFTIGLVTREQSSRRQRGNKRTRMHPKKLSQTVSNNCGAYTNCTTVSQ